MDFSRKFFQPFDLYFSCDLPPGFVFFVSRMVLITEILVFIALTFLFYSYMKESRSLKFMKRFPAPRILPIIGQFLHLPAPKKLLKTGVEYQKIYGTRVPLVCGPLNVLWLTHPDDVAKVLASKDRTTDKPWLYPVVFKDWLGSSLFNQVGKEYFRRRKMIMPAFNFGVLENFSSIFNRNSQVLINLMKTMESEGESVEFHSLANLCALDIIFESATGTRVNCLANTDHEYSTAHIKQFKFLYERALSPWLWPKFFWQISPAGRREKANREILNNFIEKIIHERKANIFTEEEEPMKPETFDENGNTVEGKGIKGEKKVFLDLLLHEQRKGEIKMTDQDIREETSFFIFAGHDTTSSTLTWAVYLLAINPEEQAILHEELDEVFGDDRSRSVDASDLPQLKYLECCIKETLRLYPPAPFFGRNIERDLQLDDKATIPEGTDVLLIPWLTHRLPEFYPEPEKFSPSRFLPENSVGRHPYAFMAFSGGPRNCMGQKYAMSEIKTILANVFRNFSIKMKNPEEEVFPNPQGVVTPLNGLHVLLNSR